MIRFVDSSISLPNWVNDCNSLKLANVIFKEDETFFMALNWAALPTRETECSVSIAGLWPELKRSVLKKIWPSVIEITLVGI